MQDRCENTDRKSKDNERSSDRTAAAHYDVHK